jgi:arsenate reductase
VIHIGFPDPAQATGTQDEQWAVFRQVRDDIRQQVLRYLTSGESEPPTPDEEEI